MAAQVWDGGGTNDNWSTATNWNPNAAPANNGTATLVFAGSTRLAPYADVNWSLLSIIFSNNAGVFVIDGSQLTIRTNGVVNNEADLQTINNTIVMGAAQTWNAASGGLLFGGAVNNGGYLLTINGANNVTLDSVLSGSGGLTKSGNGVLTLSSPNVFSGTLTLSAGTLALGDDDAAGHGGLTISAGTIQAVDGAVALTNVVTASGNFIIGGSLDLTFSGTINLTADRTITVNNSGVTTFSGQLGQASGSPKFTKAGTGILVLSHTNTLVDTITVSAGALQIEQGGALGTTAAGTTVNSGAGLYVNGGITVPAEVLTLSGIGPSANGALRNLSGDNSMAGAVTFAAAALIKSDSGTLTLSGAMDNGGFWLTNDGSGNITLSGVISGTGGFVKLGAGTMTISGGADNTFTGDSTVNAGTLLLNKTGGFDVTAGKLYVGDGIDGAEADVMRWQAANQVNDGKEVHVLSSGLVDLNGYNDKFKLKTMTGGKVITGAGTLTLADHITAIATNVTAVAEGNVNLGANRDFTVNDGSPDVDLFVPALLSGAYNLEKKGAGTLVLGGVNTFSGGMIVTAGTLGISNNAALGSGTLTFNGGSVRAETAARTVTNALSFAVNSTIAGAQDLTFTGNGPLAIDYTLTVSNTGFTKFSGIISGAHSFTDRGPGTLILDGPNTHDETYVYGVVNIQNNSALSGTSKGTWVYSGGALQMQGDITVGAEPLSLSGSGVNSDGALRNVSGSNSWAGTITLAAASTIASDSGTLTVIGDIVNGGFASTFTGAGNVTASGVISGTDGLTRTGAGTLTLSGNNTFSGALAISAGTLSLGAANRIATVAMTLGGGRFDTAGFNETVGTLALTANSTIDCGSDASVLHFSDSSAVSWTAGATLTISNWSGNALGGGADQIIFGSSSNALTASQVSKIRFFTGTELEPAIILSTGEIVPGGRQADVSATKTAATNVVAGANLTYTIIVSNAGPSTASNIVVSDVIPASSTFFAASTGGSYSGGTVTWTAFNLANEASTNLTVTVTAPGSGSLTNTVSSTDATYDPDTSNNNGSASAANVVTTVTAQGNAGGNDSSCVTATNVSTRTWSHTVSAGANRVLVVGISFANNTRSVSSITYGGVALTQIGRSAVKRGVELWRLVAPTVGTANIVATWDGNVDTACWGASFTNVDQTTPTGSFASASGTSATPSANVNSATGDLVVDAFAAAGDAGSMTAGANQTSICTGFTGTSSGDARGGGSYEAGASSVTMSWTLGASKNWDICAVALKAAAPRQADIQTTKSAATTVLAGQNLVYTISVTNHGPTTATNLIVTDTLPSNATFVSASSGGTNASGVVTWPTMNTFAYGSSTSFTVTVTAPASGSLTNITSSTATTSDPDSSNNNGSDSSAKAVTSVTPQADIKTTKTGSTSVVAGSNLTYTITVTNLGPSTASNVVVSDVWPAGATFVSASSGGTNNNGVITWPTLISFASGATTNFTITLTAQDSGTLTNVVSSTSDTGDPDASNNNGTASAAKVITTITPSADIATTKTGSTNELAGANLIYTITVTNLGPSTASNVVVSDTLPAGAAFVSASSGGTASGGVVTWPTMTNFANAATTNFTVTVTANASGSMTNVVSSSSDTGDPVASNHNGSSSSAKVIISITPQADIATTKSGATNVVASSNLTYTITVTNLGPSTASNVVVSDTLPLGATFVSASGGGTNNNGVITWPTMTSFTNAATTNFTVIVSTPASGTLTNTVSSSASTIDPDSSNNDGSASTAQVISTVTPSADVVATKTGATNVVAGSNLTYTITVTNMGPSTANNVVVSDTLPTNSTFVSVSGGGSYSEGVVTWPTMTHYAIGSTTNFTLTVTAAESGSMTNSVSSMSTTSDPDASNNNGSSSNGKVVTTVTPSADVATTKTGPTSASGTSNITYTITVTNHGPSTASNVVVSDTLPAGVAFVSASSGGVTNNGIVTWPTLTNFANATFTNFTVVVTLPVSGSVTNTVSSSSDTGDPDVSNNNGSSAAAKVITAVVAVLADVATSVSGPSSAAANTNITYTITVTNLGPGTASNVMVLDTLPAGVTFVSASGGGNHSGGVVTWPTMTNFANAASTNFTVTVTGPDSGTITNRVSSTSDTSDPVASNNDGSSAFGQVMTLILGVNVSGFVYLDANKNGFKDSGEAGTGLGLHAKIYATTNASGPALQVAAVDGATGAFTLTNIYHGTYMVIIDNNNLLTDVTPSLPSGWTGTEMPAQIRTNVAVAFINVPNRNFGLIHSLGLSGRVFKDIGAGGGTANDGVMTGAESGLAGVTVRLTDNTGATVYDTAITDGSGNYALLVPSSVANGATLKVTETNPPVHLSTGGAAGDTGGAYDRASDTVTFTYTSGANYSGVNFGDVPDNSFVNDSQQAALPGGFVLHAHSFTAGSGGSLTFSVASLPNPSLDGWSQVIYRDLNCNGAFDPGEAIISGALIVAAGDRICILVKDFVPATAPFNAQNQLTVTAAFTWTGAAPALSTNATRIDLTTAGNATSAGLTLLKSVDKETALPGEVLAYTVSYANKSSAALTNLVIFDQTPAYTTFTSATYGALPNNITGIAVTAPSVGASGPIKWTFTGSLAPASSGTVTFSVTVSQ